MSEFIVINGAKVEEEVLPAVDVAVGRAVVFAGVVELAARRTLVSEGASTIYS